MKIAPTPSDAPTSPNGIDQWIPFENWLSQFGLTRQTGFRWRRVLPWMEVQNIMGRVYISAASAQRFSELAAAGKLAGRFNPAGPPHTVAKKAARIAAAAARKFTA